MSQTLFILGEIVYFCAKTVRNWKIFIISLFADEYAYTCIHFLWIKIHSVINCVKLPRKIRPNFVILGKTVKFYAQVARNLIIFSNIHLCFIYFKQLLSTVESSLRYKRCKLRNQAEDIQLLFWSEIAFKKSKPREIGSSRNYNI